jgi:hypothetical protein
MDLGDASCRFGRVVKLVTSFPEPQVNDKSGLLVGTM